MPKRAKHGKSEKRKEFNKKKNALKNSKNSSTINKNSTSSSNPHRKLPKGQAAGFYRDKAKIKLLNLYKEKPKKLKEQWKEPAKPARIEPDRRWFGNTRVSTTKDLEKLREALNIHKQDPYSVIIDQKRLPLSLLVEPDQQNKMNILEVEPFEDAFGPKSKRKRPKLLYNSLDQLMENVNEKASKYKKETDYNHTENQVEEKKLPKQKILESGQSKRIRDELYKVIDSSDVILQVIDARDPMGTRSKHVEDHLKKNAQHKHLILILNKCDLIPNWATAQWVKILSKEYPTLAFHASVTNPFGKGSLIQLIRQFDNLHKDKKTISIGLIGYPNVGKSSIINTLKKKSVCKVAPVPGETKVWQYITLTKRIYLIDSPGVVYNEGDTDADIVLKGAVRAERIEDATFYIDDILERVDKKKIIKAYDIEEWTDTDHFLTMIAKRFGRLKKGGEPNLNEVAKMIINDWQRGKIAYFVSPNNYLDKKENNTSIKDNSPNENMDEQMEHQEKDKGGNENEDSD